MSTQPQPSAREVRLRILEAMIAKDWPHKQIRDTFNTYVFQVTRIKPKKPKRLTDEQINDIQLGPLHD